MICCHGSEHHVWSSRDELFLEGLDWNVHLP